MPVLWLESCDDQWLLLMMIMMMECDVSGLCDGFVERYHDSNLDHPQNRPGHSHPESMWYW